MEQAQEEFSEPRSTQAVWSGATQINFLLSREADLRAERYASRAAESTDRDSLKRSGAERQ
jgi:hypothetical protein